MKVKFVKSVVKNVYHAKMVVCVYTAMNLVAMEGTMRQDNVFSVQGAILSRKTFVWNAVKIVFPAPILQHAKNAKVAITLMTIKPANSATKIASCTKLSQNALLAF